MSYTNETPNNDFNLLDSSETGLRLFHPAALVDEIQSEIKSQLPFMETLLEQFESLTGWKAGFAESTASYKSRKSNDDGRSTLFGNLAIEDMSEQHCMGEWVSNRTECDNFAATLDSIIGLVQEDRQLIDQGSRFAQPTVALPFDQWVINGTCGVQRENSVGWMIDDREHVRFCAARCFGGTPFESASASLVAQTVFRTAVTLDAASDELASMMTNISINQSEAEPDRLQAATVLDFDPVTGAYEIANMFGDQASDFGHVDHEGLASIILVDSQAQTAIRLSPTELSGCLYSGQILVFGDNSNVDIEQLNSILGEMELTTEQTSKQVLEFFGDVPMLALYRQ